MSNPDKKKMDTEEEINENPDESDGFWSDEEDEEILRELILALPALSVSERSDVDEAIRRKAVIAAELVVAAAQEAAVTKGEMEQGVGGSGETVKKKKVGRPRKHKLGDLVDAAGGSSSKATALAREEEPLKKPRKTFRLTNPPEGPPKCNICGRNFGSWKGVHGHLRVHKEHGYIGFHPPPTFNAAEEGSGGVVVASSGGGGFGLGTGPPKCNFCERNFGSWKAVYGHLKKHKDRQNLGFHPPPTFNAAEEGSGGVVAASSGGGGFGLSSGGLQIDLNAEPMEKEVETGSGSSPKFDLNRSPPQDEDEEKEDKAE